MIRNLENKVVWITGAGSGIGQDAAIKLSKLGMKVILSGEIFKPFKIQLLNVIKTHDKTC